jgi:hypothetical protein
MVEQKSRIKSIKELLMFPDLFPRFLRVARNSAPWRIRPHTLLSTRRLKDKNSAARMASRL